MQSHTGSVYITVGCCLILTVKVKSIKFPIHMNTAEDRLCSASHIHIPNLPEHKLTSIQVDPSCTVFRKMPILTNVQ
jgi:hypothetical protein